jgi:hypothetical protein
MEAADELVFLDSFEVGSVDIEGLDLSALENWLRFSFLQPQGIVQSV